MSPRDAFQMQQAEAKIARLAQPRSLRLSLVSATYTKDQLDTLIQELIALRMQFFGAK